ncbi:YhcG family protein [Algoriphagus sp.]|uniref:PDDEXK nuclease domain-containing protein n=1 Tax=Algoriphagus sp. TaxID=1872435 RepID=UPI002715E0ED|nr:PDDEXK nuclease domain-containing protein [Algoriphagus sp.]MDO8966042.1 PDDEXK nuclease domain-containing protein [Algoriphagus sp.]MDP3200266.1 PDDEXK nuclease domain-containing protein [Algoriphagus sp.]
MTKKTQNLHNVDLFQDLSEMIEQSQKQIAKVANSALTLLFWNVGNRISNEILNNERASYGKQIVATISAQLEANYGRNFTEKNVRRMIQFAEEFPDFQIVVTLSRQLSWSHFLVIIPLKETQARIYYTQLASNQKLSIRDLRYQISRKAFERSEIANFQQTQIDDSLHHTFKDPYLLDFLDLKNIYLENDLERAILHELETFILELGKGFAFMERQKRMIIDGEDFYLDLLFYNRNLKRLVAIELKIGKFEAAFKGQMDLYLKWLNKFERQEGEKEPVGLILCAETNKEQVELLEMHKDGIMVAEYWTELPPKRELEKKLHQLLIAAKDRIERNRLT